MEIIAVIGCYRPGLISDAKYHDIRRLPNSISISKPEAVSSDQGDGTQPARVTPDHSDKSFLDWRFDDALTELVINDGGILSDNGYI